MAVARAVGYVNNWWLILHDVSYFARFAPPSPLNHLWSLSIEEQFYIVWPFLLMAALQLRAGEARRTAGVRPRLAAVDPGRWRSCSAILMAVLYHPSLDPSRVYYGTDTRALELLVGAALAMVWPSRRLSRQDHATGAATRSTPPALAGLIVIGLMFWRTERVLTLPLPRRLRPALGWRTVLSVAALRPSRLAPRADRRLQADALDRRTLLRHLPLALSRSSC